MKIRIKPNIWTSKKIAKVPRAGALYLFKFRHASKLQFSQGHFEAGHKDNSFNLSTYYHTYGDQDRLNLTFMINEKGIISYTSDRNTWGELSLRKVRI